MTVDYKALARSQFDPLTQNTEYRREKARLRRNMADAYAAKFAAPGSAAARNDPNRYGSAASRANPGLFGPNSLENQELRAQNRRQAVHNMSTAGLTGGVGRGGLRRKDNKAQFSLDDLDDDQLLQSLGLNIGSLRRGV